MAHVQPELGLGLGNVDEYFFVLCAKNLDLGHVFDPQQLLAQLVGNHLDFGVVEAVRLQRINDAVDITELVIEKRALNTGGQGGADVTDFFAHGVPDIGHLAGLGIVLELHDDLRLTRLGIAAYLVGVGHLLQAALQLGSDQFGHLLRGGARPHRAHHHGPEGERWVFILTQLEIREPTHEHQHHHQVACQWPVIQRPAGQVEAAGGLWLGGGRGVAICFVFHCGLTWQQVLSRRLRVQQPSACQTSARPRPAAGTA